MTSMDWTKFHLVRSHEKKIKYTFQDAPDENMGGLSFDWNCKYDMVRGGHNLYQKRKCMKVRKTYFEHSSLI